MGKISTENVQVGGGTPKTIAPGVSLLKINDVKLVQFPFMVADEGYYLIIEVETKPIPDFEGFFIDKDDESKGRYEGQIGQIKTNRYYYKDGETKTGIAVNRDMEILKIIKNLCLNGEMIDWFDSVNNKYETIEEFVEAFAKAAPYKGKWFNICVAGKEFARENGYVGYDLYFPKLERGKVAFEIESVKVSKLLTYNEMEHLTKLSSIPVNTFTADPIADATIQTDFPTGDVNLNNAPQFEL